LTAFIQNPMFARY